VKRSFWPSFTVGTPVIDTSDRSPGWNWKLTTPTSPAGPPRGAFQVPLGALWLAFSL
jgi:hypothetical protein